MPARPLTPAQRRQHAAFLRELARTGNATQAARAIGMSDATLHNRRKRHPAFAARWDATLAATHARLHRAGGVRPAEGAGELRRAAEGETTISMLGNGRLQLRRARRDAVTRADEQRFLLALSATANVSLAAAAAGASPGAFNARRRANPAFAREMRAALEEGYERLELALLESWSPASGDDAQWRDNAPPALPPMTPAQALQLMHLHHKPVRWRETVFAGRLLPGETSDVRSARLARLYRARLTADAETTLAREVAGAVARLERLAPPIVLPDLAQVKGWSNADPVQTAANAGRALGEAVTEKLTEEARTLGLRNAHPARRGWEGRASRASRDRGRICSIVMLDLVEHPWRRHRVDHRSSRGAWTLQMVQGDGTVVRPDPTHPSATRSPHRRRPPPAPPCAPGSGRG